MTPKGYLNFMGKLRGMDGKTRRARIDDVAEKCNITDMLNRHIGKLSKGYRQRVGLAQALLPNPDVLILDEPTIGLDPRQIVETRNVIRGLAGEHTVILSTHILPEVSMTCNRVVIIDRGKVVAIDTPENLQRRMRGADALDVEVRGPPEAVRAALEAIPRVISVQEHRNGADVSLFSLECELGSDVREQVAQAIVAKGWGLRELRPGSVSLEEIFVQLV